MSVLATIGIMLVLMQRFGAIDVPFLRGAAGTHAAREGNQGPEGAVLTPAATDPTAALIDSLKREVETAKKGAGVQPASSTTTPVPPPRPRTTTMARTGGTEPVAGGVGSGTTAGAQPPTTSTTTEPESGATLFGIGVVSYLDGDRAKQESDRLAAETSLPTLVLPYRDAGTTMYRVVLGRWASAADAEQNANDLMARGLINEARVVTVPR